MLIQKYRAVKDENARLKDQVAAVKRRNEQLKEDLKAQESAIILLQGELLKKARGGSRVARAQVRLSPLRGEREEARSNSRVKERATFQLVQSRRKDVVTIVAL